MTNIAFSPLQLEPYSGFQIEPFGGLYADTAGKAAIAWGLRFGYLFIEKKEPESLPDALDNALEDAGWHVGVESEVLNKADSVKSVALGGYQSALIGFFNYELGMKAGGRYYNDVVRPGGELFAGMGFFPNRTFFWEASAGHYFGTDMPDAEFRVTAGINLCGLAKAL